MEDNSMRKSVIASLSLVVVILGSSIAVSAGTGPLRAKIPFAFNVEENLLPPGEYLFKVGGFSGLTSVVMVSTLDGQNSFYLPLVPGEREVSNADYRLIFNRYGDRYFLSKVKDGPAESKVAKSRFEKRVALETVHGPAIASIR
jgi:hypothetical protein